MSRRVIIIGICLLLQYLNLVYAEEGKSFAVFLYSGPSIDRNAPLVQVLRLSIPNLEGFFQITGGISYRLLRGSFLNLEAETSLTQYLERQDRIAVQGAFVVRIYDTPWSRIIPGSFAFGNGLSYAGAVPEVEELTLSKTSKLFYHLTVEFEFAPFLNSAWSALVRVHHRSGMFGVFNDAVGGSDYICLGGRYRF